VGPDAKLAMAAMLDVHGGKTSSPNTTGGDLDDMA
jgi:hypothetical protein